MQAGPTISRLTNTDGYSLTPLPRPECPFQTGKRIGRGGIGEIYEIHERGNSSADKVLKVRRNDADTRMLPDLIEVALLSQIRDIPGLMRASSIVGGNDPMCPLPENAKLGIVMPRAEFDMHQYLEYFPKEEVDILPIFARLASALVGFHRLGFLHLDLKPSNFLIMGGDDPVWERVVVSDFGLARKTPNPDCKLRVLRIGTPGYIAPEVERKGWATGKSDVFSLGSAFLDMLTQTPSILLQTLIRVYREVSNGEREDLLSFSTYAKHSTYLDGKRYNLYDLTVQSIVSNLELSPRLRTLIVEMLHIRPGKRPSMIKVFNELDHLMDAVDVAFPRPILPNISVKSIVHFPDGNGDGAALRKILIDIASDPIHRVSTETLMRASALALDALPLLRGYEHIERLAYLCLMICQNLEMEETILANLTDEQAREYIPQVLELVAHLNGKIFHYTTYDISPKRLERVSSREMAYELLKYPTKSWTHVALSIPPRKKMFRMTPALGLFR